jgi:regulation of enolase protein 1 (concanavalin A-like superfamily)
MTRPLCLALFVALAASACDPAFDDETEEESPAPLAVADGWSSQDIGDVAAAGSYTRASGVHTVKASGADIYGKADEFHFVYKLVSGDSTVVARVTGLQNSNPMTTDPAAKAVVMIRESLGAGSKFVAAELTPVATNKYRQHSRSSTNGTAVLTKTTTVNSAIPSWLRVVRKGATFTTWYSSNGSTWKMLAVSLNVSMAKLVYVGFGATSHQDGTLITATFDNTGLAGTVLQCVPGSKRCSDQNVNVCSSAGTWQNGTQCPFECSAGSCWGECWDNSTRCVGSTIQLCQNHMWTTPTTPYVCLETTKYVCENAVVQPKCTAECGGILCGTACVALEDPFLCLDDPVDPGNPPPKGDSCTMHGLGAYHCDADITGSLCETGQTYRYQYQNTGPNAYSLVTDTYWVCDNQHWQPGG